MLCSLIVLTTILGNLVNHAFTTEANTADCQLAKLATSLLIFPTYLVVSPAIVWFVLKKAGADQIGYWETVAVFGYSLTVYIVLEFAYLVPLLLFQILATLGAMAISVFLLKRELEDLAKKHLPDRELKFLQYYGLGSSLVLAFLLKFYFFSGH